VHKGRLPVVQRFRSPEMKGKRLERARKHPRFYGVVLDDNPLVVYVGCSVR
jgi:hypothetical protein